MNESSSLKTLNVSVKTKCKYITSRYLMRNVGFSLTLFILSVEQHLSECLCMHILIIHRKQENSSWILHINIKTTLYKNLSKWFATVVSSVSTLFSKHKPNTKIKYCWFDLHIVFIF